MHVERAEYEFVDRDALPQWTMRVRITGPGLEEGARPIMARVGSQRVQSIISLVEGEGIQGFLEEEPATGDELSIGYADEPLIETGITYDPAIV